MNIRDLYRHLNALISPALSCEWDNDGLQCCPQGDAEVTSALLSLDVTEGAVAYAKKNGANLIISHHPVFFKPLFSIGEDGKGALAAALVRENIAVMSFHTRFDALSGGVNDILAQKAGLSEVRTFQSEGNIGRIGTLKEETSALAFAKKIKKILGSPAISVALPDRSVKTVAVIGGDAKDFISDAKKAGADLLLCGNTSYNAMTEAEMTDIAIVEAGHFHTENPGLLFFAKELEKLGIEYRLYNSFEIAVI